MTAGRLGKTFLEQRSTAVYVALSSLDVGFNDPNLGFPVLEAGPANELVRENGVRPPFCMQARFGKNFHRTSQLLDLQINHSRSIRSLHCAGCLSQSRSQIAPAHCKAQLGFS